MALRQSTLLARMGLQQALRAVASGSGQQCAARGFAAAAGKSSGTVSSTRHLDLSISLSARRMQAYQMLYGLVVPYFSHQAKVQLDVEWTEVSYTVSSATTFALLLTALNVLLCHYECRGDGLLRLLRLVLVSGLPTSMATSISVAREVFHCLVSR